MKYSDLINQIQEKIKEFGDREVLRAEIISEESRDDFKEYYKKILENIKKSRKLIVNKSNPSLKICIGSNVKLKTKDSRGKYKYFFVRILQKRDNGVSEGIVQRSVGLYKKGEIIRFRNRHIFFSWCIYCGIYF
jgi:hypothetical protein